MIASPGIKFIILGATVVTHSVTIASNIGTLIESFCLKIQVTIERSGETRSNQPVVYCFLFAVPVYNNRLLSLSFTLS